MWSLITPNEGQGDHLGPAQGGFWDTVDLAWNLEELAREDVVMGLGRWLSEQSACCASVGTGV